MPKGTKLAAGHSYCEESGEHHENICYFWYKFDSQHHQRLISSAFRGSHALENMAVLRLEQFLRALGS